MAEYVVRAGDTLARIAESYGVSLAGLLTANPWIRDPNLIFPGQKMLIPEGASPWLPADQTIEEVLPGFRGNLSWIHQREGHQGRPYWPGGNSGVTLDPGLDLGHASPELIIDLYWPLLSTAQRQALERVMQARGRAAQALLQSDPVLTTIRITKDQAAGLFPHAASPYWRSLTARFPGLTEPQVPEAVHTAILSLGYNRGPGNRDLEVLASLIRQQDWEGLARAIAQMQQDHPLQGIRNRRRMEAALISDDVDGVSA